LPRQKKITRYKIKLRKNDMVQVIAGKDKGRNGKILEVDRKKNRVIVEGINMITKHQKANAAHPQGGLIKKEAPIHVSNVMYLHNGVPTKIGFKLETAIKDGKSITIKKRIAKKTGEDLD